MKLQRTRNASRNIVFGVLYRFVAILGPFAVRTVMLYIMGTEYVGLNSLFTSILSFLSLAELGIGNALVYSMYKPIADDDDDMVCALLNLYRKLYRYIGIIIITVCILLLPFLKYLVKGDCPVDINLYTLYFIYVFNTVISYFMFAYKQSLLAAFQRSDIISKRSTVAQFLMYMLQIVAIIVSKNYYVYIIMMPIATIFTNILNAIIVDKMYPQYKCIGSISRELELSIRKKVLALFGTKANSIVLHAADNMVISAFLGLSMVGVYGNYYYVMNSIIGIMTVIYNSLTAGLGNSIETESIDKNYRDFRILTLINSWLTIFCTTCLLCLYQPFMKIWVHEKNMLDIGIVVLLALYFFIYQIRRIVLTYKDAAGIWWEDRYRPYIMMIVNVVLNIVLVQIIGLYGVILSTIISMIISAPIENWTVFKYLFKRASKPFYFTIFGHIIVGFICSAVTFFMCNLILFEGIYGIIFKLVICIIIPNLLMMLFFYRTEVFKQSLDAVTSKFKRNRGAK